MKVYRIAISIENGSSGGFEFFSSKREAERWRRAQNKEIKKDPEAHRYAELGDPECLEIGARKHEILRFLRAYAGHPDNG